MSSPTNHVSENSNTQSHTWVEVETIHHSSSSKELQIVILQNQTNQLFSALTSVRSGKRWVVVEDLEIIPSESWSDVVDVVINHVCGGSQQKHHSNKKLWEVRK